MSTKQCNLSNWKSTTKQIFLQIKMKKPQVCMILRENKRLLAHLKINKRHGMVMLLSMNAVNNYALQPSNACTHHRK